MEDGMKNGAIAIQPGGQPEERTQTKGFSWESDEDDSAAGRDSDWDDDGGCPLVSGSPVNIKVEPEILCTDGDDFLWDPDDDASPPSESTGPSGSGGMSYGCGCCGQQFAQLRQLMEHMAQHAAPHSQASSVSSAAAAAAAVSDYRPFAAGPPVHGSLPVLPHSLPEIAPKIGFACVLCGKVFARQGHLAMHCRLSHGLSPSQGWGVKVSPTSFMQQVPTRDAERPFVCQLCQKRFVRKHHLQAHLRSHSGIKPFSCPMCGKALSSKQSVGIHMRQHQPERQPPPLPPPAPAPAASALPQ